MEITYLNQKYCVEEYIFNDSKKQVDIVLPVWNNVILANYALRSLKKFTNDDLYNLWIIDNGSTNSKMLKWLNKVVLNANFDKNTNINLIRNLDAPKNWGGSENHSLALNLSIPITKSKYVFFMHDDAVPLHNSWLDFLLKKANEGNRCVGTLTNWEKENVKFLHCSGVLIEKNFILENDIDFKPNKPHYDTIGVLTLKLIEKNEKYFICRNSKNEPDLRKYHLYEHKRGQESFDDGLVPIWAHQGRGSSANGDRGNWIRDVL